MISKRVTISLFRFFVLILHVVNLGYVFDFLCCLCLCEALKKKREELLPLGFLLWEEADSGQEASLVAGGVGLVMRLAGFPGTLYLAFI